MRARWIAIVFVALAAIGRPGAQQSQELIIRGGTIVNADGRSESDVRIRNGTIAEIGRNLSPGAGAREIDAHGLFVMPGGIDPHVHVGNVETYATASAAALAGGITTISNFVSRTAGESPVAAIERHTKLVSTQATADVIFHLMVGDDADSMTNDALAALAKGGDTSMKFFMNRPGFEHNPISFLQLLGRAGRDGFITMIHCEDGPMLTTTTDRMMAEGHSSLKYFHDSRPIVAEEIATQHAVAMSEITGAPVYIVHLSSERALRAAEVGEKKGLPVYVESRPVYLHMTREVYDRPNASLYIGQPPMHEKRDQDAIWEGLAKGSIHVLATDHNGFSKEQKLDPAQTVQKHNAGFSNLQEMRPMLYSEGVRTKRLTLERFVAVTATNAAKLFGTYPKKGTIAVGSDGDVVVWDPNDTRVIKDEDMLAAGHYSAYAGWKVTGWPKVTIRRGEVVYEGGKVTAAPGSGQVVVQKGWKRPESLK